MAELFCEPSAVSEGLLPSPALAPAPEQLGWDAIPAESPAAGGWDVVRGLDEQQRRNLGRIYAGGVLWRDPSGGAAVFRLSHGGDVEADGNCLFAAVARASRERSGASELRRSAVRRFIGDYGAGDGKEAVDAAIRHLYAPDVAAGWGVHVVQEVKLLAGKADREALDAAVHELVDLGMQREMAQESIYKERCVAVVDGPSWAKYMSISGSPEEDEYDIITLQYTVEGLLSVDDNRAGQSAAFGDDIAIECLATEFKREIYVVQVHGFDSMVDEESCVFFLPHRPRDEICGPPVFLLMKGSGWCGAGADHYEPLLASSIPAIAQEKAAVVL